MNIRDSYIHGADSRGVVKSLYFATSAESVSKADFSANYTTAAGKDLIFLLADTLGTKIGLPIPTLNQNTTGYASSLLTVKSTSANNHYLTFVDSNNTTAEAESFYTSGDIYFKPSTGVLTVKSVTVSNTFNYSGIGSDTTSNAARKIWFASSSDGTPVVSDNFKYNPSTKTLTVDKISGPTIVIGNTTLYLDGANNVLTPDTVISNTSTNNTIPSSKAVWDAILTGIQANDAMVFKGFLTGGADAAHTAYTPGADRGDTYKVQTAGYINGEYYQVNDTFICTTDGTVAATSSNVNTIKANWGVVEGNGDYVPKVGDSTITGVITISPTNISARQAGLILTDLGGGSGEALWIEWRSSAYPNGVRLVGNPDAKTLQFWNTTAWKTVAFTDHTHSLSIATAASTDTNQINLTAATKYKLTAGGSTYIFTTPVDTWRNIYTGGTSRIGTGSNTKAMNFASSNLDITYLAAGTSTGQSGNANYFTINLEAKNWTGATSSAAGTAGYMPGATSADRGKFLRGDGTWVELLTSGQLNPSISNGTDDNTVKITVGGEDSSDYTIPYATKSNTTKTFEYVTNWNVDRYANTVNFMTCGQSAATGAPSGYTSGVSFMTTYVGFQLAVYGGGSEVFYFRKIQDNNNWSAWRLVAHTGNISNKAATISSTELTTIATIAGVDITAKIPDVTAQATELASVLKTLTVSTWTNMAAVNTYTGTYAIQISSGNVYASGIFTACGGTDSVIDEIPLHVADKGTNTWRPYARISAGQLQMTTSETTGTARTYTIKILKLI